MITIPNASLNDYPIPGAEDDWNEIGSFALTFDGYEFWGSFEACSEVSQRYLDAYIKDGSLPTNLTDLRTCLFFEQRRWRHYGYEPDEPAMHYIKALVVTIRSLVQFPEMD